MKDIKTILLTILLLTFASTSFAWFSQPQEIGRFRIDYNRDTGIHFEKGAYNQGTKHYSKARKAYTDGYSKGIATFDGGKLSVYYDAPMWKSKIKVGEKSNSIDSVISFEELQAFLDAKEINMEELEETVLNNASFYGRIFAKSGGIKEGIEAVAKEQFEIEDLKPVAMNGITDCKVNLLKLKMGKSLDNFFEGMACDGGCLNGALCIHHGPKNVVEIDKFGKQAKEQDIKNSINLYKLNSKKEDKDE